MSRRSCSESLICMLVLCASAASAGSFRGTENVAQTVTDAVNFAVNGIVDLLDGNAVSKGIMHIPSDDRPLPDPSSDSTGGGTPFSDRIVGGNPAPQQIESFVMTLEETDGLKFFSGCGGTLISRRHVLTAAHCIKNADEPDRSNRIESLFMGAWRPWILNGDYPSDFAGVESMKIHDGYNMFTYENDVALIKLSKEIDVSVFRPAEMADSGFQIKHGDEVKIYGFGDRYEGDEGDPPEVLQEVSLRIVEREPCQTKFTNGHRITSDMICAYRGAGYDSCNGDSGGPMFKVDSSGQRVLVGIVSHGLGCARENMPGVYARVDRARSWVDDQVCNDQDEIAGGLPPFCPGGRPWEQQIASSDAPPPRTNAPIPAPSPRPTPSPTSPDENLRTLPDPDPEPSAGECVDYDKTFLINDWNKGWKIHNCHWVYRKEKKADRRGKGLQPCKKSAIVRDKCPETCGCQR